MGRPARHQGRHQLGPRRILEHATEIQLPARLSAAERAEAERLYPEVDLDRGIGEALAAAPALEERYRLGRVAAPVGWAMVEAAVDWRRTGMTRPVTDWELRLLCRRYLEALQVDPPADRRGDAEGLAWACQPWPPGSPCCNGPAGDGPDVRRVRSPRRPRRSACR